MSYQLSIIRSQDWLHAKVTGENSAHTVASYMKELAQTCREAECSRLLIEERLEGPRLDMFEVFEVVALGADASRAQFKAIAFVDVNAEGDLMRFAETVAANRGAPVKVFPTVAEATAWLLEKH